MLGPTIQEKIELTNTLVLHNQLCTIIQTRFKRLFEDLTIPLK